jgi:hypothetical protein
MELSVDSAELSIVTVCMNRREHLLRSSAEVSRWPHHREHLIVDWSSSVPLRREELPADPRLRLLRVDGQERWNPSLAYNFAMGQAAGEVLIRMDADCWPTAVCEPRALLEQAQVWVGSGTEGRYGQFIMPRAIFERVGGFNEYLRGWGFEDKDLRARLEILNGIPLLPIPSMAIGVIIHSNEERMGLSGASGLGPRQRSMGLAAMRASRLANRLTAAHCPWGPVTAASTYRQLEPDRWTVDPASVPRPSAEVADEIDHARRMAFWSCFLAIPEVFLEELPVKLVPPPRRGHWPVRWWHRLWWHSGRRLLQLPILVLSLGRGRLEGLRQVVRPL